MSERTVLALITARGGSKGIPGKNIAPLGGKPLIAWSIEAARRSRHVSRVVVSTDDEEIARVSRAWGAEVPFMRPRELALDHSPHIPVILHAVEWMELHGQCRPEYVLLLQPTSPLRRSEDIDAAVELIRERGVDSVIGVGEAASHPYLAKRIREDGWMEDFTPKPEGYLSRQSLPPAFAINGAIYLVRRDVLMERKALQTERSVVYVMPPERSLDIDTPWDLHLAELILRDRAVEHVQLAGREIGPDRPCFIIAEAGVNHNGDPELARRLIDVAVEAGADAVKFQTFKAERLMTPSAPKAAYQKASTGPTGSQLDVIRKLELSGEVFRSLRDYCVKKGILFLSTPFDEESADFLDELGVPVFKIPSGEITNPSFLAHVARKGKPIILSTGMADEVEVARAVEAIRATGHTQLILLQCTSAYPADPGDANLRAMLTLGQSFGVAVGYSDHTLGVETALAAVALGACVVEKHFTLDRNLPGPDHQASAEPAELAALVRGIRCVEKALGDGRKAPAAAEADTAAVARKSLVAAVDIPAGTVLTEAMITAKRPGTGIPPAEAGRVVGREAVRDIHKGEIIAWEVMK